MIRCSENIIYRVFGKHATKIQGSELKKGYFINNVISFAYEFLCMFTTTLYM